MVTDTFIGANRKILSYKSPKLGELPEHHLEDTRDLLKKIEDAQDAHDFIITPRYLNWDFSDKVAKCNYLDNVFYWDQTSWSQLSSAILPSYGGQFIHKTALLDTVIAENAMAIHCAAFSGQLKLRTINKRVEVAKDVYVVRRYVRAVCSKSYQGLKNSTMLTDILSEVGNKPLYRFDFGDVGMNAKIMLDEHIVDPSAQYPVLNAWNSDVLLRNAGVGGGLVRQICSNGMIAHVPNGEHTFIHKGNYMRIRTGIKAGIQKFHQLQLEMVADYNRSLSVVLEDPYDFLEKIGGLTKYDIEGVKKSMNNATSSKYGTLANVIDGITHYAHTSEMDIWRTFELEKLGSIVMSSGLKRAKVKA